MAHFLSRKETRQEGRKKFQPIGAYTPMAGSEFIGAFALPCCLLPAQAEAVGNHGDEFAIGGFALDVRGNFQLEIQC